MALGAMRAGTRGKGAHRWEAVAFPSPHRLAWGGNKQPLHQSTIRATLHGALPVDPSVEPRFLADTALAERNRALDGAKTDLRGMKAFGATRRSRTCLPMPIAVGSESQGTWITRIRARHAMSIQCSTDIL